MEHKIRKKRIGVIFGLKKEMDLFFVNENNIFFDYGYGKSSKLTAHKLIEKNVDIVFNFGFAGSISNKIKNGDIVLIDKIYNLKKRKDACDALPDFFLKKLQRFRFIKSNLLTVNKIITEKKEKLQLSNKYEQVSVIDMEGYFIMKELLKKKIPFVSLKVIFDDLSFDIPSYLSNCVNEKGDLSIINLLIKISLKPQRVKTLLKLQNKYITSRKILAMLINNLLT